LSDKFEAVAQRHADPRSHDRDPNHLVSVPAERILQDWKEAHERALAYLDALDIDGDQAAALADRAVEQALEKPPTQCSDALHDTLTALRALIVEEYPEAALDTSLDGPFLGWRLSAVVTGTPAQPLEDPALPTSGTAGRFPAMPPLTRGSMVPNRLARRFLRGRVSAANTDEALPRRKTRRGLRWTRVALLRRLLLGVLVLIPTIVASGFMSNVLPHHTSTWIELAIVIFFGALFGWISIGFWTALLGFFTLVLRDRFAITALNGNDDAEIAPEALTAICMPICEEPVERVFAGLKAIYDSVERRGALRHFHFFILSDSADPSTCVREEEAWATWCREVNGFGRIFYRRRRVRIERKAGNVADFCRRWGKRYRYVIMLDADSVMSGETLVRLLELMERHPDVGMIQTAPTSVKRRSLFARVQQFASRVYGPMFAAGLHFWQLGDGQYWGHNAIIRIAPFMENCALPRLPGKPPLGGEILSHDFVEAALMGRAGWTLWLAYDLGGSWEETPSSLLEELKRDRRWCQGNLQHLRLLFTEGLFGAHRALFINGVLSYVSAALWFAFLTLSTAEAIINALRLPNYFPHGPSLFPEWPVFHPLWAYSLLAVTGMILFLPKLLSIVLIAFKGERKKFGGVLRLTLSVVLEILVSSLFAPIRMLFHTKFVLQNVIGRTVSWKSQEREDAETSWREAFRFHVADTLFASAWGISLRLLNPDYFWWVTPIVGALILSIPLSVLASRVRYGDRARALGLFLIPEEVEPPTELVDLDRHLAAAQSRALQRPAAEKDGFVRAIVDPYVNALHRALIGRPRRLCETVREARRALVERALAAGPAALDARERRCLLMDPELLGELHERVWQLPERSDPGRWGRPGATS
jgi:membrane glycosyltransferase